MSLFFGCARRRRPAKVKAWLVNADERDTDLIFRSLRNTARVARNSVSREVVETLSAGATFEDIRHLVAGTRGKTVYESGDTDAGIWSAGMVQGLIHDVPTVRELVERIVADAESIVNGRLAAMASTGPESCADDD